MNPDPNRSRPLLPVALAGLLLAGLAGAMALLVKVAPSPAEQHHGTILHETRSDFSHIRVRANGTVRSLLFVDEAGLEYCQSSIDLAAPAELRHGYARALCASLLYRHPQERILIIGLGGGGMVRFFNEHLPGSLVEAVEIDPEVVAIAGEYFGTRPGPRTVLHTADAFEFFDETRGLYDAIYGDAFLHAPETSGHGDKAARLKTRAYLATLRNHLVPGGVAAFNLIESDPRTPDDLETLREVFAEVACFEVPGTGNLVVIALRDGPAPEPEGLQKRATALDAELSLGFSLSDLVDARRK